MLPCLRLLVFFCPSTMGHEVALGNAYLLARNVTRLVTCPHYMGWAASFTLSIYLFHSFILSHKSVFFLVYTILSRPHSDTFRSLFHLHYL